MLFKKWFLGATLLVSVLSCSTNSPTDIATTGDIRGQVTDQVTGVPVSGINISTQPTTQTVVTDANGDFLIPQVTIGNYTIDIKSSLYVPKQVTVSVTAGGVASASISLMPNSGIVTGKVLNQKTGDPIVGVTVSISEDILSDVTDASGSFSFAEVSNGPKTLSFSVAGYKAATLAITVNGGSLQNLTQSLFPTIGSIDGVLTDSKTGAALEGVSISSSPVTSTAITDAAGIFNLENVPEGTYTITASKNNYGPSTRSVVVTGGDVGLVSLALASSVGSIVGIITDSKTGAALTGVSVSTIPTTTAVVTDAYGAYAISSAPAATYTVSATKAGYVTASQQVVLVGGSSGNASFVLAPSTGRIVGKVSNASGGAVISGVVITTTPATVQVTTDINGDFVFNDLVPGAYTLTLKKTGYNDGAASVNVLAAQDATASPQLTAVTPVLSTAPTLLDFGITSTLLQLTLGNSAGQGTLTYVVSKPSDATWLTISSAGGQTVNTDMPIQVTIDRSTLAPSNYSTIISVTSNGGTKSIPVSMVVPNPSTPQLTLSKSTIDFSTTLSTQTVTLTNSGYGVLNYTITEGLDWLTVSPASGSANTTPVTLTFNASRVGLVTGNTYTGVVTVNSNGGNSNIGITMTVSESAMAVSTLTTTATTATTASFSWSEASPLASFSAYKLYSSTSPNVSDATGTLEVSIASGTTRTTTVNGTPGTVKYYRVFTYNKSGVGTASNEVNVIYPAPLQSWTLTNAPMGMAWDQLRLVKVKSSDDSHAWAVGDFKNTNHGIILRWDDGQSIWVKEQIPDTVGIVTDLLIISNTEIYAIANTKNTEKTLLLQYNGISWSVAYYSGSSFFNSYILSGSIERITQGIFWSSRGSNIQRLSTGTQLDQGLYGTDLVKLSSNFLYSAGGNYFYYEYSHFGDDGYKTHLSRYNGIGWTQLTTRGFYGVQKDGSDKLYLLGGGSSSDSIFIMKDESFVDTISNVTPDLTNYFPIDSANIWIGSYTSGVGKISHYNGQIYRTTSALNLKVPYAIYFHRPDFGWMAATNGIYMYR